MRYAEKEVEYMEKQALEEAEKEGRSISPDEIILPNFKELQAKREAEAERQILEERAVLEKNVSDIDAQIRHIQQALLDLDGSYAVEDISENVIAEQAKGKKRGAEESSMELEGGCAGFAGPGGEFVEFPAYNGEEEPNENKKAFTLFCKRTRREVKNSLSASQRKDKVNQNPFFLNLFPSSHLISFVFVEINCHPHVVGSHQWLIEGTLVCTHRRRKAYLGRMGGVGR